MYANRRRIRGTRGRALQRCGSVRRNGRTRIYLYETGGMRRTHLRGHANILKGLLVHVSGFNLGLLLRTLTGIGTPRSLQGRRAAVTPLLVALWGLIEPQDAQRAHDRSITKLSSRRPTVQAAAHGSHQKRALRHGS